MIPRSRSSQSGFTLVELLVSLAVTAVLLLGVLATFDLNNRITHVQTNVADMQQSLRVAQDDMLRIARMAGRGGLPAAQAIQVTNNVAANTNLVTADSSTRILEGTDVIRLRGVFNSSVYQVDSLNPAMYRAPDPSGVGAWFTVAAKTGIGVTQDLAKLQSLAQVGEALLIVSPSETYVIGKVTSVPTSGTLTLADGTTIATLTINYEQHQNAAALGGAFPVASFPAVAYIGILEDYGYYVREQHAIPSDLTSDLTPKLARARFSPGSNTLYDNTSNSNADLADNILDLQAAVSFAGGGVPELRLSTLARTDRRDPGGYQAPLLTQIGDHVYTTSSPQNARTERMYRRRVLVTDVDLRNL
jgi:prepilin-type N-terminal cleavage/methylation domain-containing protein